MRALLKCFTLLASLTHLAFGRCLVNTLQAPEVTVEDSEHLLVNWAKSFDSCNASEILIAKVHTGADAVEVAFAEKEAKIKANPCLTHPQISVSVQSAESKLWSQTAHYNDYNIQPKVEDLYSGLLEKQVVNQTCLQSNGKLFVPGIPDGLRKCVLRFENTRKSAGPANSTQFSFTIVDPQSKEGWKVVKTEFKVDENCPTEQLDQGETSDSRQIGPWTVGFWGPTAKVLGSSCLCALWALSWGGDIF